MTFFIMTNYKQFKLLDYTLTSPLNLIITTLITTFFFKKLNYKSYILLKDGLKTYILCPTRSFMNLPILNLVIGFVRRSDKFASDVTYCTLTVLDRISDLMK